MNMNRRTNLKTLLLISVFLLATGATATGKIIFVDANAPGANNGSSWADAYQYLGYALDNASSGDDIHVAQGIYRPSEGYVAVPDFNWRTTTFQLRSGVAIKGGYAGFGEPDANARDIEAYETILSGDLNGDDIELTNPADMWGEHSRYDNSNHVLTGSDMDANAIIDGFTITAGYNSGLGAGMYNRDGNPTVTNCTFTWNCAEWGGGMGNWNSSPKVISCKFESNAAAGGGGIDNVENSNPILINCTFSGNSGFWRGGGMLNGYAGVGGSANPILINCIFSGNSTDRYGGGMYNEYSSPIITNCTFTGNAAERGGGICSDRDSSPTLTNCILWSNTATYGHEIYLPFYSEQQPSAITVNFSDVQGGAEEVYIEPGSILNWEVGNIDADPCFADPNNGDYRLSSQAGRWDANSESWVLDYVSSPCIDAGNPGCPLGDEPNDVNNIRINMGAYGGTTEASKTPADWRSIADLTNDWTVDYNDLKVFVDYWLETDECIPSDLNHSQSVDFSDFAIFGQQWSDTFVIEPGIGKD